MSHAAATGYIQTGLKDFHHQTCFQHIHSLPPGSWARFPLGVSRLAEAQTETFWRLPGERLSEKDRSFPETVAEFRETFINAVDLRLRADVPVGFELSGGLDSSSVVAVACQLRNNDLTTYTVKVPGFDEEPYARALSETYPFDYRVLDNPEGSLLAELEAFADIIQEPFHSPNIYSQFQIRRLLKADGVGVVLTGGGADEVLAGYQRLLDGAMQTLLQQGQHARVTNHLFQRRWGDASLATRTLQAHRYLGGYLRRRCRRQPDRQSVPDSTHGDRRDAQALSASYEALPFHQQQLYQFQVGLLPYYLRNNDHFTMAIPVEQRFPFLDHRLVELGLRAPVSYLFKNGWSKYLLRKAMEPFLPEKILWRREKMGFPFALERFLSEHREVLAPPLDVVQQAGLDAPAAHQYDDRCRRRRSATQLWRACSTGLWLRNVAHWSQPAVAHV
ncbi:MAG: asparagine synthase C-terminal domain-containing protein [Pirellulales bacterium]|nr:asparagine synthase C-terminal domain-containing protein [Pirellulales bacterium]